MFRIFIKCCCIALCCFGDNIILYASTLSLGGQASCVVNNENNNNTNKTTIDANAKYNNNVTLLSNKGIDLTQNTIKSTQNAIYNIGSSKGQQNLKYFISITEDTVINSYARYFLLSCLDYVSYQTELIFFKYNFNFYKHCNLHLHLGTALGLTFFGMNWLDFKYCKIKFLDFKINLLAAMMYYRAYSKQYNLAINAHPENNGTIIQLSVMHACHLHIVSFFVYHESIKIDFLCLLKLYRLYKAAGNNTYVSHEGIGYGNRSCISIFPTKDFSIQIDDKYIPLAENCFIPKKANQQYDWRFLLNVLIPDISIDILNFING